METVELRDAATARDYLLQGLWFQRVSKPSAASVKPALEWALEVASSGQPLQPLGFLADLGSIAFGTESGRQAKDIATTPGWSVASARAYEDFLLGKIYADWTFERAADALRRYAGSDRAKGLAYVAKQFRDRAKLGGVELSPGVIRGLLSRSAEDNLRDGYESLERDGPSALLLSQYEELARAARRIGDILGGEDVIALEQRTALADMGTYVAHRQILQMAALFESRLPARPVRPWSGRKEVPTRVLDEDQYPVGGYSSISNRGSIESLLHSQLAYMETDESPDLFDVKFVRDELFFYSRDENQFRRRRRVFVFVWNPSLTEARFKDSALPCQRIVLVQALALTLIRRLSDWLSHDALRFVLLFPKAQGAWPLLDEAELMEILLIEQRGRGLATVAYPTGPELRAHALAGTLETPAAIATYCGQLSRTSQVHVLELGAVAIQPIVEGPVLHRLLVTAARPQLLGGDGELHVWPADEPLDDWVEAAMRILQLWV